MREILFIAGAGACGAVARYGVVMAARRAAGDAFPWGTLVVNVAGSFALGLLMPYLLAHDGLPQALRLALTVGFFGAFTTFSAFSYETVQLAAAAEWSRSALNGVLNLTLSIAGAWAGLRLGAHLVPPP